MPLLGCEAVKGGGNVARWCNKPFEDLIIKAAQTPKQADRAKLYEQAQVIVKEEAPWITIAHSVRFDPMRKEVHGLQDGRDGAPLLHQRRSREATVTGICAAPAWAAAQDGASELCFGATPAQRVAEQRRSGSSAMFGFLLRRVALIVPTFLGVTLLAFALIHLIPGDPVENLSGERGMDPARRERLLHEFGLDRPLPVQYLSYVGQVLRGDLGTSLTTHESRVRTSSRRCFRRRWSSRSSRCCSRVVDRPAGRHPRGGQAQHGRGLRGDGRCR